MFYPDKAVRTVVFKILSDAGIDAFDSTADAGLLTYVLLLDQDNTDFSTKNGYGFIHRMTLSAVNVCQTPTGREDAEDLINKVIQLLTPDKPSDPVKIDLTGFPFRCWQVNAGKTKDLTFSGDTETVYQKIVSLTLSIDALQ